MCAATEQAARRGTGTWRANGRQVKRRIGPKRDDGTRDGLTRTQAEAELRRIISETQVRPSVGERLTVDEVARRYRLHAERRGRKRSTVRNIESETRVHLVPFFGDRALDAITSEDIIDLVIVLEDKDLAPKTIRNVVATLSELFNFAMGRGAARRTRIRAKVSTSRPFATRTRSASSRSTSSTR
jgi:integrase